jgi:SAM-dependent methyltransferase
METAPITRKLVEIRMGLSPRQRVLDVGSGHKPSPRADFLVDRYMDNRQRMAHLATHDKPFVQADLCHLPFTDKAFDYSVAHHVIEHVDQPQTALEELMRVSQRGHITCPSLFWELLHPQREYHKWVILLVDGKLVFYEKSRLPMPPFGSIFEAHGLGKNFFLQSLFRQYKGLFSIFYKWHDEIHYLVNPTDPYYVSFFRQPYDPARLSIVCQEKPPSCLAVVLRDLLTRGQWD